MNTVDYQVTYPGSEDLVFEGIPCGRGLPSPGLAIKLLATNCGDHLLVREVFINGDYSQPLSLQSAQLSNCSSAAVALERVTRSGALIFLYLTSEGVQLHVDERDMLTGSFLNDKHALVSALQVASCIARTINIYWQYGQLGGDPLIIDSESGLVDESSCSNYLNELYERVEIEPK